MTSKRGVCLSLAIALAPLVAALLATPVVSRAAEPEKHVRCEITKDGKKETEQVKRAEECQKIGGKTGVHKTAHGTKQSTAPKQ